MKKLTLIALAAFSTVAFAQEAARSGGGGSSGGCNAGFAGLLLFAAIPLLYFRKK